MNYNVVDLSKKVEVLVSEVAETKIIVAEGFATRYEFGVTEIGNNVIVYELSGRWIVHLDKRTFFLPPKEIGIQVAVEYLCRELPYWIEKYSRRHVVSYTDARAIGFALYQAVMGIKIG